MSPKTLLRHGRQCTAALIALVLLWPVAAFAAGSNMPWEQPLQQILDSVQGPVAKIIAVLQGRGRQRRLAGLWQVGKVLAGGDYVLTEIGTERPSNIVPLQPGSHP